MQTIPVMNLEQDVVNEAICLHCGNPAKEWLSFFCCPGCKAVYEFIHTKNLTKYYDLKQTLPPLRQGAAVSFDHEDFRFLDEPEFQSLYSNQGCMEFYLEGVHCAACVWLTEKVSDLIPGVISVRLNLGNSVATVRVKEGALFSRVAEAFTRLGYRPHPIVDGVEGSRKLQKKENRLLLIRLGVAGACAGNIMLLTVSLYGGATGELAECFRWISFGLFLPVFFFSAIPFYTSAWNALKFKQAALDIPVVFGLVLGAIASFFNLLQGSDQIYFDSLAMVVFLLLCSRYLFKQTQQTTFDSTRLVQFLLPSRIRKINSDTREVKELSVDSVHPGDHIEVLAGECIPVDGVVISGSSNVNSALLTGEAYPHPVSAGARVFAGTLNLEAPVVLEVTQSGSASRLGEIVHLMEECLQQKAHITEFADRVSKFFVSSVVLLSLWVLFFHSFAWNDALNRSLAVALVTCPCVFALATPLTFALSMGRLARQGILVKGSEVIERLSQATAIFLDKTGTLTEGSLKVLDWQTEPEDPDPQETEKAVFSLESRSSHPLARSLVRYLSMRLNTVPSAPDSMHERIGVGITGTVGNIHYVIQKSESQSYLGPQIDIFKQGKRVASVSFIDEIRQGSKDAVQKLQELGLQTFILSGDQQSVVRYVGEKVGILPEMQIANASPEEKCHVLKKYRKAVMVGDGANDAIALSAAHVGVSAHSGIEASIRASDIYLAVSGVQALPLLITVSRETMRIIRRNLALSTVYNLATGVAAVEGKIGPLLAAILMPLSASFVFISSLVGTRALRKALKGASL